MRKLLTILLLICMTISLVACGENAAQSSTSESSQNSDSNRNSKNENKDIMIYEGDKDNFTPLTNDYLYIIKQREETDTGIYEIAVLESFDDNGEIVQRIEREVTGENVHYFDNTPEDVVPESYSFYSAKLRELLALSDDSSIVEYSYSKELTSEQATIENEYSKGDFTEYSTFTTVTDDYCICEYIEKYYCEGSISNGYKTPGSARTVDGVTSYDYDYTVEEYGECSYTSAVITSFDENGNVVGNTDVILLDSEDMVDSFFKQRGWMIWDEVSPTTDVEWDVVNEMGYHVEGKYVWIETDITDGGNKMDYALSDSSKMYFSIPYLTDSQIQTIKTW